MLLSDRSRRRLRGFTLIEIAVVLVIIAVFMAMGTVMFRGFAAAQKRSITATRLATVDAALVQFVILNRRLPCPANGTIASGGGNAGVEVVRTAGACTGNQANGVVPWTTLGLTEADATDGWERRLTYRTGSTLVADAAMDMSWCDPAGGAGPVGGPCVNPCTNAAIAACTTPANFLMNKGLEVRNVAGTQVMTVMTVVGTPTTAAAYVVISHGESGGGGYLNTVTLAATTTTDGTEEKLNYANLALRAYYVDDGISDVPGTTHFDDMVSRPSVLALAAKAGLAPRSH